MLFWRSGGFRILGIVYEKNFLTLKNNKKMSLKRLNVEKYTGHLFFRNPPLPKISTFLLGQTGCAYFGKSAYYGCAYYEWGQYMFSEVMNLSF